MAMAAMAMAMVMAAEMEVEAEVEMAEVVAARVYSFLRPCENAHRATLKSQRCYTESITIRCNLNYEITGSITLYFYLSIYLSLFLPLLLYLYFNVNPI